LRVDNKTVLVLLGKLSCSADDLIDKPSQIHRLGIEFELSSFDLREVQYFVDEAQEVGPGGIDTAQRFQRLFRAEARRISGHHLGQADNGIEGRPQLVAHAGEELHLRSLASASCRLLSWISSNSRTFSIAITAWSAKVMASSICRSLNGLTTRRINMMTPMGMPSRSKGTPSAVRAPVLRPDWISALSGSFQ